MVSGKSKIVDTIILKTPQIVSTKLWDEVQLKLLENQKHKKFEKSNVSLLDGLIYCKSCGNTTYPLEVVIEIRNLIYTVVGVVEYQWKNPNEVE